MGLLYDYLKIKYPGKGNEIKPRESYKIAFQYFFPKREPFKTLITYGEKDELLEDYVVAVWRIKTKNRAMDIQNKFTLLNNNNTF